MTSLTCGEEKVAGRMSLDDISAPQCVGIKSGRQLAWVTEKVCLQAAKIHKSNFKFFLSQMLVSS